MSLSNEPFSGDWSPELAAAIDIFEQDSERGFPLLKALALTGDRAAIEAYGSRLAMLVPATDEAVEWSLKAAAFNSTLAIWNLAMIAHERGNQGEVEGWIDRAAALGLEDAHDVRKRGYDVEAYLEAQREAD